MCLLCLALLPRLMSGPVQGSRLHVGDKWSADRIVRYVSAAADIDLQDDDHFEYVVENTAQGLDIRVSRTQTGTHLANGTFVPATEGEPEQWLLSVSADGQLVATKQPQETLERILSRIVMASWNGPNAGLELPLIKVKAISPVREKITYDETVARGQTKIEGFATLDPDTRRPLAISLTGEKVPIPGGSDIVSIRVEYTVKPKSGSKLGRQ